MKRRTLVIGVAGAVAAIVAVTLLLYHIRRPR